MIAHQPRAPEDSASGPSPPRRTLLGVFLTASTVPAMVSLSLVVNGVPESVAPWVGDLFADMTIPVFLCAGLAFFASRTVYRLTLDLSRAQQLGSYRLVERIGAGGMGEVWRARHRLLARPAAIKLIRPDMLNATAGSMPAAAAFGNRLAECAVSIGSWSPEQAESWWREHADVENRTHSEKVR